MICGELCVPTKGVPFLKKIQEMAPDPKPVPGNCALHGYSTDTGITFGLDKATHNLINLYAQIYTVSKQKEKNTVTQILYGCTSLFNIL